MNEAEAIERIKAARSPEPEQSEPTEIEVVEAEESPEEAIEEFVEAEEPEHEAGEVEESNEDLFYVDLDGEEITSEQIRQWKSGNMMQSDYTSKTQKLSEERKALDSDKEVFNSDMAKLQEQIATLSALTDTNKLSDEEVQDLREDWPEKYIEYIEQQNKIDAALKDAKNAVKVESTPVDAQAESAKLFADNPQWLDNGKPTKAFEEDSKLINDYASSIGYSAEDMSQITQARHMQALLDAAKYRALSNKNASIEKKVRKAPVTTRPKASAMPTGIHADIAKLEKAFKANPSDKNAVELRKARRKLNN